MVDEVNVVKELSGREMVYEVDVQCSVAL